GVHPGYGFLSENPDFAEACAKAGLVFIGPPAEAIRAMGSKAAAKALMQAHGVPVVPGYHGDAQDPAPLAAEAERIGFPVLIKASAGGGGRGMRIVTRADEFARALVGAKREAAGAFGDDRVLVEHPVTEAITGLDLVEWQLRIAAGETLPLKQSEIALNGHAIEVRLYAENPERGFLPATGILHGLHFPEPDAARVDTGVRQG